MHSYRLTHLKELESESMHILREVAAQFENPALLFSGGKDSIVCFHLARKAFFPARVPFPLVHVDTGHNFEETMTFRDDLVKEHGAKLIVGSVQESIDTGRVQEETGYYADGRKHGVWKQFNASGRQTGEATYVNGQKDGVWTVWDDQGVKRYHMVYSMGRKIDTWQIWDEHSNLVSERVYGN